MNEEEELVVTRVDNDGNEGGYVYEEDYNKLKEEIEKLKEEKSRMDPQMFVATTPTVVQKYREENKKLKEENEKLKLKLLKNND